MYFAEDFSSVSPNPAEGVGGVGGLGGVGGGGRGEGNRLDGLPTPDSPLACREANLR